MIEHVFDAVKWSQCTETLTREHTRAEEGLRTSCHLLEAGALALLSTDIALLADIVWAQSPGRRGGGADVSRVRIPETGET